MNSKSQLANDGAWNGKRYGPLPRPIAASLAAGLAAATIASVVMAAASPEGPTPASSSFPAWLASAILSSLAILAVLSRYEREVRNLSLDRDSLEGRLLRASEETDRALRMRSQFLVEVSQEIRTPMNGVLRFAEVLQRTDLPPEQARHVDTIAHSGRAMMAILDDILDLARIEADDFSPQEHPVNVARLVEECVGVHRTSVARHGLKLGLRIDSRTPGSTITDALLLRRIVGYLLAEATPRVDDAGMKISLDFETGTFRLTVGDFEMPEGQVRHGAGSPPPLTASTGIGLSIAERMAKILGGSLETEVVEANLEAFVLRLPYRAADPARLPERRAHRHE